MKQIQEIALCKISDHHYCVRARTRPGFWPFFSKWEFVVLGFGAHRTATDRVKFIGDTLTNAEVVYQLCLSNGVTPDGCGYFLANQKSETVIKEVLD